MQILRRGSVLVIPPGIPHWYSCTEVFEGINLIYLSEWFLVSMEDLWAEKGLVPLFFGASLYGANVGGRLTELLVTEEETIRCERELSDIELFLAEPSPSRLLVRSAVLKVMAYLARAYCYRFPECKRLAFRKEVWHVLREVEAAVSGGSSFRAGEAAKSLGMSLPHLGVLFRQATGHSMTTYYRNRRVQEAKRLLLDGRLSVTQVAHASGFYDAAQLCRHFRGSVGISPAAYRRQFTGGPGIDHATKG